MSLLVRTWNLFHGNATPPERRGFLEEMVRLVASDGPDVVCLQEVPVWALRGLEGWSGMTAFGAVAARPRAWSAELGRLVTELDHGLLRSALTGQANAILLSRSLHARDERALVVSRGGERRVCQAVRIAGEAKATGRVCLWVAIHQQGSDLSSGKRGRQINGGGGLSHSAFLVGNGDYVSHGFRLEEAPC